MEHSGRKSREGEKEEEGEKGGITSDFF